MHNRFAGDLSGDSGGDSGGDTERSDSRRFQVIPGHSGGDAEPVEAMQAKRTTSVNRSVREASPFDSGSPSSIASTG